MINQSFVFLDRISLATEQKIWQQGIHSWEDFVNAKSVSGISGRRKVGYNLALEKAKRNLSVENMDFFANNFPQREHWRLWNTFKDDALFVDIETTGYYGDITVLGMYDGKDTKIMVRGQNLDKELFKKTITQHKMLVTFNGSSFDLPIIKKYFGVNFDIPHIDLRHVCSRIGLTGGLKAIEKTIGIARPDEVEGVSGAEAVNLWHLYKATGDRIHLEKLVQYNEEDIINLKPLAEHAIPRLWQSLKGYG